jgi:hypothetical protein
MAKFAAGVVDTGGKFAAGAAARKLIHEKTRSKKSRDTVLLMGY